MPAAMRRIPRARNQAEIVALRHQLTVLQRTQKHPPTSRSMVVGLSLAIVVRLAFPLIIVKPETVLSWHRKAFRWYWTWKIRHGQTGVRVFQKRFVI
jgi:hypothetical protein